MRTRAIPTLFPLVAVTVLLNSCGGGYDEPSGPSNPGGGVSQATITITASGAVSPAAVTITSGNRVTFVNNDTVSHTMSSDPHPVHTDCPGVNHGTLAPGQSRETMNLTARTTCGFHDHDNPDTASLKGSITVQ